MASQSLFEVTTKLVLTALLGPPTVASFKVFGPQLRSDS